MDPNLLPQGLRDKEEQELKRQQRQPRGFKIELNEPTDKKSAAAVTKSDRSGASWWQNILGIAPVPVLGDQSLTNPTIDKTSVSDLDWLTNSHQKKAPKHHPKTSAKVTRHKRTKVKKPAKTGWVGRLLGQPLSPILPIAAVNDDSFESLAKTAPVPETIKVAAMADQSSTIKPEPKSQPQRTVLIETKRPQPSASVSVGWWSIIKGLFGWSHVVKPDLQFAITKTIPAPSVPAAKPTAHATKSHSGQETKKPTEAVKSTVKPIYNLVPKRERGAINVNLMPQELKADSKLLVTLKFNWWLFAIILPLVLVTGAAVTLHYLSQNLVTRLSANERQLTELNQQIGDFVIEEQANNHTAQKITIVKRLMDNKIVWNKFFALLEKYTLDGVYFDSLVADTSGELVLPGVAENYTVLAQQIAVFRDASDFVKEVKISSAQLYSDVKAGVLGTSFQVRLTLQDNIFKQAK